MKDPLTKDEARTIDLMVAVLLKQLDTLDIMTGPQIDFSDLKIRALAIRLKMRAFVMEEPEVKVPPPEPTPKGSQDDLNKGGS